MRLSTRWRWQCDKAGGAERLVQTKEVKGRSNTFNLTHVAYEFIVIYSHGEK